MRTINDIDSLKAEGDWVDSPISAGKFRGHDIMRTGNTFIYKDDGREVSAFWKSRGCGHCGKGDTREGFDGCIGRIPGAVNACCGHGCSSETYVQFEDGSEKRGEEADTWLLRFKSITLTEGRWSTASLELTHGGSGCIVLCAKDEESDCCRHDNEVRMVLLEDSEALLLEWLIQRKAARDERA